MKIKEVLINGIKNLADNDIEDANLKARLILEHELGVSQQYLIINTDQEIEEKIIENFNNDIEKVIFGKPVQYITNNQEFFGLEFFVNEDVLIPQPDTEILVEEVIKISKDFFKSPQILDVCTGSGAIAVSIANKQKIQVWASDISSNALDIAQKNATLNMADVKFIQSDMFQNIEGKFDIIVSNPPYIETNILNKLSREVQEEPRIALDGGKDGLDFYKILTRDAKEHLNKNGILAVEIGYDQKEKVIELFENEGFCDIYSKRDYSQNDRIVIGKYKGE